MAAPEAYFDPQTVAERSRAWRLLGSDGQFPARYLTAVAAGQRRDRVWCTSVMWSHLRWLVGMARAALPASDHDRPDAELVAAWFPDTSYVRIRCADHAGQALRFYARLHPAAAAGASATAVPDFEEVRWLETVLVRQERAWDAFFSAPGLTVTTVDFGHFLRDPEECVQDVTAFLGLSPAPPTGPPAPARSTGTFDRRWRDRYRAVRDELPATPGIRAQAR